MFPMTASYLRLHVVGSTMTFLLASFLAAGCSPAPPGTAQVRDPDKRWELLGLERPGEILIDRWGVPHIYAETHYDAFFLQGFAAARDRLWQIDTWRRRGLGELSAVFGPEHAAQDRAARLFLYRGSMFREWLAYGSDAKRITEAFVAGINAWIDVVEQQPELLAPEFALLGYRPARWAADDVVRIRSHGLWRNVASEVARARVACELGLAADRVRMPLEPAWEPVLPADLDPCDVPADVLDDYHLAKAPVRFDDNGMPAVARVPNEIEQLALERAAGSNNWAVAPEHTATGRPILADDPHRAHAVPSLRYIAHLTAPGLDVIGAGEPALPGISIGHNGRIAFGLTIFAMDQEDLYFYRVHPDDPSRYSYDGRWEQLETIRETVAVRDGEPHEIVLAFTRHGPVVHRSDDTLWVVRAAWLEAGMAPYFGSIEYMRAQNWDEFVAALNRWGAPAENQVYADVHGNIGYKPAGLLPRRPDHDGLLPVPGDGRYEWHDFHDMDELPVEFNPERGWVATANANILPPDFPIDRVRVGFEWTPSWRHDRIAEVLNATPRHSIEASHALQLDNISLPARMIVAALRDVMPAGDADAQAIALLGPFVGDLGPDSAAAALFEVWFTRHLRPALTQALLGDEALALIGPADSRVAVEAVVEPARWWSTEARDALLQQTLAAAWNDTVERLGDDPRAWRWADLHRIALTHPLAAHANAGLRAQMSLPDLPLGGSHFTPHAAAYGADDFRVRSGASWRMVLDVGNWDAALMTNAPGQSGVPGSPHFSNLLEGWAAGEMFPLLYSRGAVESATVQRIVVAPARDGAVSN
jgi:penicillin G amidase